jgi:hypothetical protein
VRELVRAFFVGLDVLLVNFGVVEVVDQQFELAARIDDALRVRIENFEEFALSGHESTEHENPDRWVNMGLTSKRHIVPFARQPAHSRRLAHVLAR